MLSEDILLIHPNRILTSKLINSNNLIITTQLQQYITLHPCSSRRKSTLVVVNIGDVVERNKEIKSIKDRQPEQIHEGQWEMVCCVRRQGETST